MALLPRFKTLSRHISWPQASSGITLMEMAMAMMIVGVVGVGVSGLLKVGAEHNLSERQQQNMQMIAMNLVDDLRFDLRTADSIDPLGGGSNTLVLHSNGKTITYALNTGTNQISRQATALPMKIYNDPNVYLSNLQVKCAPTCFQIAKDSVTNLPMVSSVGTPKEIVIPSLIVTAVLPAGNQGTALDQAFGVQNTYKLKLFSFNVSAGMEFK